MSLPGCERQCAGSVLLVRPLAFGHNEQTAASNRFQHRVAGPTAVVATAQRARAELDRLCGALSRAGVRVCLAEDSPDPPKPDAVFPNNWVSWHRDGTTVLYPMHAPNRRAERRAQIVDVAERHSGFRRRRLLDLSHYEREARYLEGTGSLVLDHVNAVAYACRSVRTDAGLLREWARLMGYESVLFDAGDSGGTPLYHTNVMLAIGTRWCVACTQAIAPADRERVVAHLRAGARELIEIDPAVMRAFGANLLELELELEPDASAATSAARAPAPAPAPAHAPTRSLLVMSARARAALSADAAAWERLRGSVDELISVAVPTIETVGGGSVRCMMAEIPSVMA